MSLVLSILSIYQFMNKPSLLQNQLNMSLWNTVMIIKGFFVIIPQFVIPESLKMLCFLSTYFFPLGPSISNISFLLVFSITSPSPSSPPLKGSGSLSSGSSSCYTIHASCSTVGPSSTIIRYYFFSYASTFASIFMLQNPLIDIVFLHFLPLWIVFIPSSYSHATREFGRRLWLKNCLFSRLTTIGILFHFLLLALSLEVSLDRHNAWLVAQGCKQKYGIDYETTFPRFPNDHCTNPLEHCSCSFLTLMANKHQECLSSWRFA